MKKLILATLMGWAVLTLAASALVIGTINTAPTTSTIPYAQKGQCGELKGIKAIPTPIPTLTPTVTPTANANYRRDQGKDSIRVPMLVGDKITVVETP